ncbi:MAG: PA-phosphatase-like [Geobacteraceae bacterium]|nr:MAG: PA-phosphatase-like [Geobacteraceae bacterium]
MGAQLYETFYGRESVNHKLFMLMNHAGLPFLDHIMPVFTLLGGPRICYLYFLILALVRLVNKRVMPGRYLVVYTVATFFAIGVEDLLKGFFRVPRPPLAIGAESVRVIGRMSSSFSLPSGHAIFSFVTAFTLSYGRSWRWKCPLFLFAVLVAFSRVYVGAHYPLDVAAGGVVGVACGYIVWRFYEFVENRRRISGETRSGP